MVPLRRDDPRVWSADRALSPASIGTADLCHLTDQPCQLMRAIVRDRRSTHADRPGGGGPSPGDPFEEGRFTGPIGADQTDDFPAPQRERNILKDGSLTEAIAHRVDLEQRIRQALP